MSTKAQTIQEWKAKIASDDQWAFRAAVRIANMQTEEERNIRGTVDSNGVGFNAFDAEYVTDLLVQHFSGRKLSPLQLAKLRKIMPKYAGQLYKLVFK